MHSIDGLSRGDAITSAIAWLEGALLGTVATVVAVLAIASVGFLMLSGRIDVRRAAQVIFGCFIIFGASTIANGILSGLVRDGANAELAQSPQPPLLPQSPAYPSSSATPYDPYAGAALPPR
jgi:type IV secretory pathway VirB2 component (pilin)